ncbi:MAG: type II toxin-antitoxin system Phd/YefM family antitoxin [Deltaproteobacteria bacterium]|nr:MAG: type II toxin-antitoxin system Phd/YefM family antitoxin [Deltaproteobacteria bacterium]
MKVLSARTHVSPPATVGGGRVRVSDRRRPRLLSGHRESGPSCAHRQEEREQLSDRGEEVRPMRIENIRQVKARLNQIVGALRDEGSVVITKNGRPCAVLMPVTEDTDLEVLAPSQNKRFWVLYDRARKRAERKGWTRLQDLER